MNVELNTIEDWLDYIEDISPRHMDFTLDRITAVALKLNLLKTDAHVITISGTNGKGSTAKAIDVLFSSIGLEVGRACSPHLISFNERVIVRGKPETSKSIMLAFEAIEKARGDILLTYFEFSVLTTFYIFQKECLDIWILEIGLGGRLDAMNILDSDYSVIVSVGLDHAEYLGTCREGIGKEKAGIMRPKCPVFLGEEQPPMSVLEYAQLNESPIIRQKKDFRFNVDNDGSDKVWSWKGEELAFEKLPLPDIPVENASLGLAVLEQYCKKKQRKIVIKDIESAIAKMRLLGRFQRVPFDGKEIILDVAHNLHAVENIVTRLKRVGIFQVDLLANFLTRKDYKAMCAALEPFVVKWHIIPPIDNLSVETEAFLELLDEKQVNYAAYPDTSNLMNSLKQELDTDHLLVIGSFVMVAEILRFLQSSEHTASPLIDEYL